MMTKSTKNYLRAALCLLCMVFLIYIGSTLFKRVKIDLTEEGLFTLSKGSISLLQKLDSPIKLQLYYSKTAANKGSEGLRAFNNYFRYIENLLHEFASYSRNNLTLEVIDPRPDTKEEEEAEAYGLKKFQLGPNEHYFFGLVALNEAGNEKIIEFFDPGQKAKVEYQVAKLIHKVLNPQKKRVGILSALPIHQEEMSPYLAQMMQMQGKKVESSWLITELMKEFYQISTLPLQSSNIKGVDILMIVHPKGLPPQTLYAIDQFLMRGGKILLFVDPHAVSDPTNFSGGQLSASPDGPFKKLMDHWGVSPLEETFVGDKSLSGLGQTHPQLPPTRLLPLLYCNHLCTHRYNDPISSGLTTLTFVYPGALKQVEKPGLKYTTLLGTTEKGNTYKAKPYELNNPVLLWEKFKEGQASPALGIKIQGSFTSFYGDQRPKDILQVLKSGDEQKGAGEIKAKGDGPKKTNELLKMARQEHLGQAQKGGAIVIFSDIDFLTDRFSFKQSFLGPALANENSSLVLNALEGLTGNQELLSIRSKSPIDRSFAIINQIELEAEKKTASKVKQINENIGRFQNELDALGQRANEGNVAILQNEGLQKKKHLLKKLALLKRELREVKRAGREKIELIGKFFQYLNTLFVPFLLILIGLFYNKIRLRLLKKAQKTLTGPKNSSDSSLLGQKEAPYEA